MELLKQLGLLLQLLLHDRQRCAEVLQILAAVSGVMWCDVVGGLQSVVFSSLFDFLVFTPFFLVLSVDGLVLESVVFR